jgi:hypothetical protein
MSRKAGEENEIYGFLRHSHEEKGVYSMAVLALGLIQRDEN